MAHTQWQDESGLEEMGKEHGDEGVDPFPSFSCLNALLLLPRNVLGERLSVIAIETGENL